MISRRDETTVRQLTDNLPQAILLVAEPGLDAESVVAQIANAQATEVFTVSPEEKKKSIGVDQIRNFIVNVRTYATKRRIGIFKPAEVMTEEAQNALLKILEEPPKGLHIILLTSSTEGILSTVLSRCQVVRLGRTSTLQDGAILKSSNLDDQSKQQVLFLASGRPALIRNLINNQKLLDEYRRLASDAKAIVSGVSYDALSSIGRHGSDRESALRLVDVTLTMVRFQAKKHGVDRSSSSLIDRLSKAEEILRSNGNTKLALLGLIVR